MAGPTVEGQQTPKENQIQTMVMDALGKFKSMTRDKFDMQAVLDPLSDKVDMDRLMEVPFATVYDTIFYGKNPELVGKWKESLLKYLKTVGRTTGKMAIGEISSFIGGVPGAVAGELLGSVLEIALDLFGQDEIPVAWKPGMWVVVDLEHRVHDSKDLVRQEEWSQLQMFGDFDTFKEHENIEREEYGIGLYADEGAVKGTHMIFNFKSKRFEQKNTAVLRPLAQAEADRLDKNPQYAMIKEIFILQHSDPGHLDSKVNLDTGVEVVYGGQLYNVVKSIGPHVIIEDLSGRRIRCNIEDLRRGRSIRSGAISYGKGETPGYHDQPHMAGDYIWVPANNKNQTISPGCQVSLCVLAYFHGDKVICYECYDGTQRVLPEYKIQSLTPEYNNLIASIKQFQKFRSFATQNNSNLSIWAVGDLFVHVCFGNAEGQRIQYTPKDPPPTGEYEEEEIVPQETAGNIVEGGRKHVGDVVKPIQSADPDSDAKTGYMIMALVGVAAVAALFSYYD